MIDIIHDIDFVHTSVGTRSVKYLSDPKEFRSFLINEDTDIKVTEKTIRDNWPAIYGTSIKNEVMPKNIENDHFHLLVIWLTNESITVVGYIYKIKEDRIYKLEPKDLDNIISKKMGYKKGNKTIYYK